MTMTPRRGTHRAQAHLPARQLVLFSALAIAALGIHPAECTNTDTASNPKSINTRTAAAVRHAQQCLWETVGPQGLRDRETGSCPLAVDENSSDDALNASPWKTPLSCRRAEGKAHCVFSVPGFRGRGVSLVVSPETAAAIVGAGGMTDLEASPGDVDKYHLFDIGAVENGEGPAYAVEDIPGKGKGAIARRVIRGGEVFLVDYPMLATESGMMADLNLATRRGVVRRALESLPEETRGKVLDLATSSGGDKALDAFLTNACGVVMGEGVPHMALFPEIARLNHACVPNAFYRFSTRTMTAEVVAYHDIQPGEEININYAYLGMPYTERRKYLSESWGFTCTCPLCLAPAASREASDARRRAIVAERGRLKDARKKSPPDHEAAVRSAEELARLSGEEGLAPLVPEFQGAAAREYLAMGEVDEAGRLAGLAMEGWVYFHGVDGHKVEEGRELLRMVEREREKQKKRTRQG